MNTIQLLKSPWKLKFFFLFKLPLAFITGLKIVSLTEESASIGIRYGYFTKNPFRSIYFACLAMAAELASGTLALLHTKDKKPSISMLVVGMKAEFYKKAVGVVRFECLDGAKIKAAVEQAVHTSEGTTVEATSSGFDDQRQEIARFVITWSFKGRSH